jgi:hypothetical protein
MTALLPRFLDDSVLSLAELCAARLDGELFGVGDAFVLLDTPDSAELRADAFGLVAPRTVVADRFTASWVHGARASPPVPWQACVDTARRVSALSVHTLDMRQCVLARGDVERIGDVRVTTPLRTAVDLLRTVPRFDTGLAHETAGLLHIGGVSLRRCRDALQRHPQSSGTGRALTRLSALDRRSELDPGYPALTRYTS